MRVAICEEGEREQAHEVNRRLQEKRRKRGREAEVFAEIEETAEGQQCRSLEGSAGGECAPEANGCGQESVLSRRQIRSCMYSQYDNNATAICTQEGQTCSQETA